MNETLKQNRLQRDHVEGSCSYVMEDQSNTNDCPNKVYLYKLHCFHLLHIGPLYLVRTRKICSGNHIIGGNMETNSENVFRSLEDVLFHFCQNNYIYGCIVHVPNL
jgi:hypothetical protein